MSGEEISLEEFQKGTEAAAAFNIVSFIPDDKALTTKAVAEATSRSPNSANNRLKKAMEKGFVERRMYEGKYFWALTERGRQAKAGELDEDWDEEEEDEEEDEE